MILTLASLSYPRINPVALKIGPLAIRWYGLAYLAGFLIAYQLLQRMIRRGRLRISIEQLGQLIGALAMGVILGGRLGWWLFYHRAQGAAEPWYEPIAIWRGGMSFHGGLIGVTVALLWWSWRNKMSFWNLADALAQVTPIGLFLGRIANFINGELVGRPTSLPWGVIFPGENFPRHPSQLYEAILEGPLLWLILWAFAHRNRRREGQLAAIFLIFYGLLRFAVEFTRQPDEQLGFIAFGWLTMGQLLSIALTFIGFVLYFILHTTSQRDRAGASLDEIF